MSDETRDALSILDRAISDFTSGSTVAISTLTLALTARLAALAAKGMGGPGSETPAAPDELLSVEEAAARLKVTPDWLYRRAKDLPFTVRLGPRILRFSALRLARWMRQQGKV